MIEINKNKNGIFLLFIIISVLFLGIGYAKVDDTALSILGVGSFADNGKVIIKNVTIKDYKDVTADEPVFTEDTIDFGAYVVVVSKNEVDISRYVTYEVTIANDSVRPVFLNGDIYEPTFQTPLLPTDDSSLNYSYSIDGIYIGEMIPAKSEKTFTIRLDLYPSGKEGEYRIEGTVKITFDEENNGHISARYKDDHNTGDLKGDSKLVPLTLVLDNSYINNKTITLLTNNNNFIICDKDGNPLGEFIIPGESSGIEKEIYIKAKDDSSFISETQRFNILIYNEGTLISNAGVVEVKVDVDELLTDTEPPVISTDSFIVVKSSDKRTLSFAWDATDNVGIDHYELTIDNKTTGESLTINDIYDINYVANDLTDGNYEFTLKVIDQAGLEATQKITASYRWTYNVTFELVQATASKSNIKLEPGENFTVTFSNTFSLAVNTRPTLGKVSSVSPEGGASRTLNSTDYTYSTSTGEFKLLSGATGDITIVVNGRNCLVEGTKVLLANGKYKNVEDIQYTDLIAVWNHDLGKMGAEYPAWIEEENTIDEYTEITFSDKSKLRVVNEHSIFSTTLNKYVTINTPEFKTGLEVLKYNKGKWDKVKVTKIKQIKKKVKYYHVITTRYFNMITDNFLTTYEIYNNISNFPGFDENLKWIKTDDIYKKVYTIEDFPYVSKYVFNTFRLEQTRYLIENKLIKPEELKELIYKYPMVLKGIKKDSKGNNMYMVTTSDIKDNSSEKYLQKENSIYKVPKPKNSKGFLYWYNHADNKIYYPGDELVVYNSNYLEAIYTK